MTKGAFTSPVTEVRMKHALENRFRDSLCRHLRIVPCLDHQSDCVLDDELGNLSCRLIEDESEVVLT